MTRKTMLALVMVLAIGMTSGTAYATAPQYSGLMSPLEQYNLGTPIDMIDCRDNTKILLQAPSGKPACLTNDSSVKLLDRGYSLVTFEEEMSIEADDHRLNENTDSIGITDAVNTTIGSTETTTKILHTSSHDENKQYGSSYPWPKASGEFPNTFVIGEPFEVTFNYQFFIADEDGDIDEVFPLEKIHWHDFDRKVEIFLPSEMDLISSNHNFIKTEYYDTMRGNHMSYVYEKPMEHSEDKVISETFTFVVNEQILKKHSLISFKAGQSGHAQVWFETHPNGNGIILTENPGYVFGQSDHSKYAADYECTPEYCPSILVKSDPIMEDFANYLRFITVDSYYEFLQDEVTGGSITNEYVEEFLTTYPEFDDRASTQSFIPYHQWLLPQAFGQTPDQPIFIRGQVTAMDSSSLENIEVCVYEVNLSNNNTKKELECKNLSSSGSWSFFVSSDDPNDNTRPDITVNYKLKHGDIVDVQNSNSETYTFDDVEIQQNIAINISDSFQTTIPLDDVFLKAYQFLPNILMGWNFANDEFNVDIPLITIKWDDRGRAISNDAYGNDIIEFQPSRYEYPTITLHEYGHHVQAKTYLDIDRRAVPGVSPQCQQHVPETATDELCAWNEGFADAFAIMALNDPTGLWPHNTLIIDYENARHIGNGPAWNEGPNTEGRVAAALWDIFDSTNEQDTTSTNKVDNITNQRNNLWNAFNGESKPHPDSQYRNKIAESIFDFELDWNDKEYQSLDNIFHLNTIREFTPPPVIIRDDPTNAFADDFDNLDKWILSGNSDWEIDRPEEDVPNENRRVNLVAHSERCDTECIMLLNPPLNTQRELKITFDRYIADNVDEDEGLYVQYSVEDGVWETLESYTENSQDNTNQWEISQPLYLNVIQDTADFRFLAKSTAGSEKIEIDNLLIVVKPTGGGGCGTSCPIPTDTTKPVVTAPIDLENIPATGPLTIVTLGQASVTDNSGEILTAINDAPTNGFPLGDTIVTWSATDNAGNTGEDTQLVIIVDTLPPVFDGTINDITVTAASEHGVTVEYVCPTATDLVDGTIQSQPSHTSGTLFAIGTSTITCTATDTSGNSADPISFDVIVNPVPIPIIRPDPIQNLQATSTYDTITVSWDEHDGTTVVRVYEPGKYNEKIILRTTDDTLIFNDGIKADTKYKVQAFVAQNQIDKVHVFETTPNIPTPQNFAVMQNGIQLHFTWDDTPITDFYIIERLKGPNHIQLVNTTSTSASFEIPVEDQQKRHIFRISSHNQDATSEPSRYIAINGAPPYVPLRVNFDDIRNYTIDMSIGDSPSAFNNYTIATEPIRDNYGQSLSIKGDGYLSYISISIPHSLENIGDQHLFISADYLAKSSSGSRATAYYEITTPDGESLFRDNMNPRNTSNTGWESYSKNITKLVLDQPDIVIKLYLDDTSIDNLEQEVYFDNLYVGVNRIQPTPTS